MTPSYLVILLNKIKLSITIDEDLIKWLDSQIKKKKFANRSHGFEYAISQLKESS
ncbi:MAG: ribbon-helix-helix domain-containing protein [Nitrosotalea sp.]